MILTWLWRMFGDGSAQTDTVDRSTIIHPHRSLALVRPGPAIALVSYHRSSMPAQSRASRPVPHRRTVRSA